MFDSKKTHLIEKSQIVATSASSNSFLNVAKKETAETRSGNDALKYNTTGDDFVDQFGKVGVYKVPRTWKDISNDISILWNKNPLLAICFTLFLRTVTRVVSLFDGRKTGSTQRGFGLKHEAILRMMWINIHHRESFWKNIHLFISVGSWKDVIAMLSYDLQYNGWKDRMLDWDEFGKLLMVGLENPNTSELLKKYLPQIKANSKCRTLEAQADNLIAKWICSLIFGGKGQEDNYKAYKSYRQLKSKGTAHQWQQLISQGKHHLIDFNTVHGRALSQLVSGKYIKNNGLQDQYQKWIATKPVAKFTGYVHELAVNIVHGIQKYQADTINAQYNQLLKVAGNTNSNLIVVKDTSTSMNSQAHGTKMSSYHVAKSMSIFLANMLKGPFHNHYIDFSSKAILREVKGSNFVEYWNTERREASANTNFLAVADVFVSALKQGVPESEFPSGIICISDGEFDKVKMFDITNVEAFRIILLNAGFSRKFVNSFKFCFWDIHNTFYGHRRNIKFETFNDHENVFYFSGYDPSVISFLTGVEGQEGKALPKTADELFNVAMDQEVLNMVEV